MTTKKIDEFGNYLPFPGFTVVADVYQQNLELFSRIFSQLQNSSLITEYNSLLPAESYHITQFSLMEQKKMNEKQWDDWIQSRMGTMTAVHKHLKHETKAFTFRIVAIYNKKLTLYCEVDPIAEETQRQVAGMTSYERNIPMKFHISLGYQFKPFPTPDVAVLVGDELRRILSEELPHHETVSLNAERPKLCYFHDMTKFIPFNCGRNPFTSSIDDNNDGEEQGEEINCSDKLKSEDCDDFLSFV